MGKILVKCDDEVVKIKATVDISEDIEYASLNGVEKLNDRDLFSTQSSGYLYIVKNTPINAYVLRNLLKGYDVRFAEGTKEILKEKADIIKPPIAYMSENGKFIEVSVPYISNYSKILNAVNAYPLSSGKYRFQIAKLQDFELLNKQNQSKFPKIRISNQVLRLNRESIPGFDGSIESLKNISIGTLNVVKANSQTVKNLKSSRKTLTEKIEAFGIKTLYDLIFWTPRRYIDKSEPQLLYDLMDGESATILGVIKEVGEFGNDFSKVKGINFTIQLPDYSLIKVSFFRQNWLKVKFKVGDEVLITGKVRYWNRQLQIAGSSIESAEQASLLPIVPIYKQSESRGITTTLILSAQRELFSRMNEKLEFPEYFTKTADSYYDLLKELHFPTDLAKYKENIKKLAYYELVYLQLLIQLKKENTDGKEGISQIATNKLQENAIQTLPFTLTEGQIKAIEKINKNLAKNTPSSMLLNGEVGSGKTLVAQSACLQSVSAGYQAVIAGPTDILAKQLYESTEKLITNLNNEFNLDITVAFLGGKTKAVEKREILKKLKNGEIDILVGTHAVFGKTVKYKNLGLIVIDEQQRFGTEQRESLLTSREDNLIPDLMMMTATPIPRSTAQLYYGDVSLIQLKEKPKGRLPIITEWIEEDPMQISEEAVNKIWTDVYNEAEKGNQTFIIAPLVKDSDKIDATSVEKIYKDVSTKGLSGLNIGFVHGKMKPEEQKEVMDKFKNGDISVLVASTVVEVGVDIPKATRMVIMSADRLGSASLHQIRGRIGRNSLQSKCYLISTPTTDNGRIRMQTLVDSTDGFEIAKQDLILRGQGTMFSTVQSGESEMMFATLTQHGKLIKQAKEEAIKIMNGPFREKAIIDAKKSFNKNE